MCQGALRLSDTKVNLPQHVVAISGIAACTSSSDCACAPVVLQDRTLVEGPVLDGPEAVGDIIRLHLGNHLAHRRGKSGQVSAECHRYVQHDLEIAPAMEVPTPLRSLSYAG
jgi:hypothetical protein